MNPLLLEARNPGPMTGRGNNTYLVVSSGRAALVDAGVGDPRHLDALANQLGSAGADLTDVLVTHAHADHAAGAPALAAAYPSARFSKYPWPDDDARFAVPWLTVAAGGLFSIGDESLVVLHTPGHSPDHVALWHDASRGAFTGDLVVAGGSVMIQSSRGGRLTEYMASLERLLAL